MPGGWWLYCQHLAGQTDDGSSWYGMDSASCVFNMAKQDLKSKIKEKSKDSKSCKLEKSLIENYSSVPITQVHYLKELS